MSESQQYGESEEMARPGRSPGGSATRSREVTRPTGSAAWLRKRRGVIEVGPASYTPPRENQITVENYAVAVNALDWGIELAGNFLYRWLKYPAALGTDLAGEVIEVGPGVTRFTPGDRVLGHAGVSTVALMRRCRRQGIRAKRVNGATLRANEVSKAVYEDFLPAALATGTYQAAPEPRVIGHGLQHIQAAIDAQLNGVSAAKIVVSLDAGH
jgi:NADPH:quinone reductase-like Zn-dependent oxidoreductase